jgi:TPR repeat protein
MDTIEWVESGQRGNDDELLRMQRMQADQGQLPAQTGLAEILYWGARGMERDQAGAAHYWHLAAAQGDVPSMSNLGGLYLKGEGVEQDYESALYWYEKAAEHEHVRALNGLGAMYFQANGVTQNLSKAYGYFQRAAATHTDGDSIFNAAFCLKGGLGTNQSWSEATALFHEAANSFGHFGSIVELGMLYTEGRHVTANVEAALSHNRAAAAMGEWGGIMRQGFDRYLARDFTGATLEYLEAQTLGQEAGASNAAYLLDRHLASWAEIAGAISPTAQLGLLGATGGKVSALSQPSADEWAALQPNVARSLYEFAMGHGAHDVALPLADYHFFGSGGLNTDVPKAMGLYATAAGNGNAQAAYNLGYLYEQGVGLARPDDLRALMYYQMVMKLSPPTAGMAHAVPVYAAIARIHARQAVRASPWMSTALSWIPGADQLLGVPAQPLFASAVPGGVIDAVNRRGAGAGATYLLKGARGTSNEDTQDADDRYIVAAQSLATGWVSQWVRSALSLRLQDESDGSEGDGKPADRVDTIGSQSAFASAVAAVRKPRQAFLRLLLANGLPTVYVHYLWALAAATGCMGLVFLCMVATSMRRKCQRQQALMAAIEANSHNVAQVSSATGAAAAPGEAECAKRATHAAPLTAASMDSDQAPASELYSAATSEECDPPKGVTDTLDLSQATASLDGQTALQPLKGSQSSSTSGVTDNASSSHCSITKNTS